MYVCYIDESGTPDVPGNTSHFILAGISIPIWHWHDADREISKILGRYGLQDKELHTAWILRSYREQSNISDFDKLSRENRRNSVLTERNRNLLALQKSNKGRAYKQTKKTYKHTDDYIHLTRDERIRLIQEIADCVSGWGFARLFAECIDKIYHTSISRHQTIGEQAFEQLVSRFEAYLTKMNNASDTKGSYGILVHDNNQTIAEKHTKLMKQYHDKGTMWASLNWLIETPLFVDSKLTRMVQVADLCSYALRRYIENQETELFERIFTRADRHYENTVGVRHFVAKPCACEICKSH